MSRSTTPLQTAVKRAVAEAVKRDPSLRGSVDAALALHLAKEIESKTDDTLSARVSATRALAEAMERLQASAPAAEQVDRLDELSARRDKRRGAAS